jgi:hypothetical protein
MLPYLVLVHVTDSPQPSTRNSGMILYVRQHEHHQLARHTKKCQSNTFVPEPKTYGWTPKNQQNAQTPHDSPQSVPTENTKVYDTKRESTIQTERKTRREKVDLRARS